MGQDDNDGSDAPDWSLVEGFRTGGDKPSAPSRTTLEADDYYRITVALAPGGWELEIAVTGEGAQEVVALRVDTLQCLVDFALAIGWKVA